jgi:hypothetical protein
MSEAETVAGGRRTQWPADYYSSATPLSKLPAWAIQGCGAASVLFILLVFAGGSWLAGGGFLDFMDMALGMSVAEMKGMYAADVPQPLKQSLDKEIETMRAHLREKRVALTRMKPFLDMLNRSISDRKVSTGEARELERIAKFVNASAERR